MKKFISMVMAAAMVVTMVPATAFAANTANFKVVDAYEITVEEAKTAANLDVSGAELQLVMTDTNTKQGTTDTFEITLNFDGAEFDENFVAANWVGVFRTEDTATTQIAASTATTAKGQNGQDKVTFTVTEGAKDFKAGDILIVKLDALQMTKDRLNHKATVKVSGDFGTSDALTFASIVDKGIKAELDEDCKDVAPEEVVEIDDIVIKPTAGDDFGDVVDATETQELTLKLSKGFEWANDSNNVGTFNFNRPNGTSSPVLTTNRAVVIDGDEMTLTFFWGDIVA